MRQEDAMTPSEWIDTYFNPDVKTCAAQPPAPLHFKGLRLRNTDSGAAVEFMADGHGPGFRCLSGGRKPKRDRTWTPQLLDELKAALGV